MSKADELLKRWLNPFSEHEIIDETEAYLNRKDKLVVGSKWVCHSECYGAFNTHYKEEICQLENVLENVFDSDVWVVNTLDGEEDEIPTEQFLACFIPKEII